MSNDERLVRHTFDPNNLPPLTPEQEDRLKNLAAMSDDDIDFSDIPRLTPEQLAQFRPTREKENKEAISVRLDPDVLTWLRSTGKGWQTRLNAIVRNAMREQKA
jgi:uncharacterized protein (DUF4415 family)